MTTLVQPPPAKSKPAYSWFGGSKATAEAPPVLIRLRDLKQPREAAETAVTELAESQLSDKAASAAEIVEIPTAQLPTSSPLPEAPVEPRTNPNAKSATEESKPATEATKPDSPLKPDKITPAKRQRQRREAKPAAKDWSLRIWQGAIALSLLSLFVLVYFIMLGGGRKHDTAGAGGDNGDGTTAVSELEAPEISIPEASTSPDELPALFGSTRKAPASARAETSSKAKSLAASDLSSEPSAAEEFDQTPASAEGDLRRPSVRETAKPRDEATDYPVTPVQMTYPVTDPGKFRYPDDTRPSDAGRAGGNGETSNSAPPRGGQWIENERISDGRRGLPDASSIKFR